MKSALRLLSLALFATPLAALAQGYPNKPIRIIVPWPPGQATDLAARIVADKLAVSMGQPFVVENKPGAGGAIGTEAVVKAAPTATRCWRPPAARSRSCRTCRRRPTIRSRTWRPSA